MKVDGYELGERLAVGANVVVRARRSRDGRAVILKLPAAGVDPARAAARLRHELDIAGGLDEEAVVVPLGLVPFADGAALVLDDADGVALSEGPGSLPVDAFLTLAIALTEALGSVHAAGIVHRDIKPANAVRLPDGSVRWTDFGVAVRGGGLAHGASLVGTLPYMAPEQTGRMHRPVDSRSDLYALGVTFYELLSGRLPFRSDDPMVLVHAHIALEPPDLAGLRPDLPPTLVAIVTRLMRKAAEARYQTARGLLADLRRLARALGGDGDPGFTLGSEDLPGTFRLPAQLVGREAPLAILREAWREASGGNALAVTVVGEAGIGKSALVSELLPLVAADRGRAVRGSCDGGGSELPWTPLLRALGEQLSRLLSASEEELQRHRAHLRAAVGAAARVLADGIPELELVTGPLAPVADLRPAEAEIRFTAALNRLVQALGDAEHPLLLVMDDLQWADPALAEFLVDLPVSAHGGHFMLVLAWREGAATDARTRLRSRGALGPDIALRPLPVAAVTDWLAEGLKQPADAVRPVGALVHGKTGGNPYFIEQLLKQLDSAGAVQRDGAGWRLDGGAVAALDLSVNVAERLRRDLADLPPQTQRALAMGSCIGTRFELGLLSAALGWDRGATVLALEAAVQAGLVLPLDDDWRYESVSDRAALRFAHARLWNAAYNLDAGPDRAARHVAVAGCLRRRDDARGHGLLEVVSHLHKGLDQVPESDRAEVAGWFAAGARRASASVASHAATEYARAGRAMLGEDPWAANPALARDLALALAEACFLTGESEEMEQALSELLAHGGEPDELVDVHELRLHAYSHRSRHHEALAACADGLALLGHPVPRTVSTLRGGLELMVRALQMRRFEPADLAALPILEDPKLIRALNLMLFAGPSAQAVSPGHLALLIARSIRVIAEHGVPPHGPNSYFNYGFVLSAVLGQHDRGIRFGAEALRLLGPPELSPVGGQLTQLFYNYMRPWKEARHEWIDDYLVAADASMQQGDIEWYGYGVAVWCFVAPLCRFDLGWLQPQVLLRHRDVARTGQIRMHVVLAALREELSRLTGTRDEGPDPASLLTGISAEELAEYEADDFVRYSIAGVRVFYQALHGEWEALVELTRSVWAVDKAALGAQTASGMLIRAMACVAAARQARREPDEARALRRWVRPMRKDLSRAASESPGSFSLLERLATSAWSGLDGDLSTALRAAQEAVDLARDDQLPGFEALAALCAAAEHEHAGLTSTARAWRRAAHAALMRWGAGALASQLAERDPSLATQTVSALSSTSLGAVSARTSGPAGPTSAGAQGALDLGSLLKAGQVISREIVLDRLLDRLLSVALENAGATRAVIVLVDEGGARVAASSDGLGAGEVLEESDAVPGGVVRYALRTGRDVVLGDATAESLFAADPWIVRHQPRSVMVVPLVHQALATAALYLENDLVAGAFTEARVHMMRSIATQASIAVANARLFADQVSLAKAHGRFVPHQFLRSLDRQDIRQVALGDHVQREMTVMFSDLRGFTGLSERLGPQRTLAVLNRYLDAMDPSIHEHGGFVDKYIGDAVLALFEQGPDGAMAAAVGMSRALRELNREAPERLRMGIGINAGPLTLGTIGTQNRLSCTVVGDSVNLAARLEGLTKDFGSTVLVSEYARDGLARPDAFHFRLIGRVAIKGREQPVDVLELVDAERGEVRARRASTRELYDDAVNAFFDRDFAGCARGMAAVLERDPSDSIAARFAERAASLQEQPPAADWQGVEQQQHK